jgi:hypothetical protein
MELRNIDKETFLHELKYRVEQEEITEEEIIILMRNYLLKEEEEWKKAYAEAAQDKEREKEAEAWERLEDDE